MKKIIYLDQNIWINLSRAYYNVSNDRDILRICKRLLKLVESEEINIPLSATHMIETRHRMDQESRGRLAKFMSLLSKANSILPYYSIIDIELKKAIMKRYDNSDINVNKMVIGKGISYLLGAKPIVKGSITNETELILNKEIILKMCKDLDIPDSLRKNLLKLNGKVITIGEFNDIILNDEESFYLFLRKSYTSKNFKKVRKQSIEEMEKLRFSKKNEFKDRDRRYKILLLENAQAILFQKIISIQNKLNLPLNFIIKEDWNFNNWNNFLKEIPTFYSQFHLMYGRDRDYNKPIHEHDLFDISSLAIAIPYCDIIVCEKRFGSIAKQAKLDKIYGTTILSDIKKIEKYINK